MNTCERGRGSHGSFGSRGLRVQNNDHCDVQQLSERQTSDWELPEQGQRKRQKSPLHCNAEAMGGDVLTTPCSSGQFASQKIDIMMKGRQVSCTSNN